MKPPIAPWQVWWINLDPTVGREQAGRRPGVIVGSEDHCRFPIEMGIVVPLTTRDRRLPHHVRIDPGSSGLERPSWALTDSVRAVSTLRFAGDRPVGVLSDRERNEVARWVHRMVAAAG